MQGRQVNGGDPGVTGRRHLHFCAYGGTSPGDKPLDSGTHGSGTQI